MDILEGDRVEKAFRFTGIIFGKSNAVLIIRSEYVGDRDMGNFMIIREQTDGAVTVFRKNAVDFDIRDISARAFVCVQRYKIVIASAFEIAHKTEMAVAVKMDAVHIGSDGVTVVEIEDDVFECEIRSRIDHDGVIDGILQCEIGDPEILYVIEEHTVPEVSALVEFSRINGVWRLVFVIEVPDAALDFKIMADILCIC